MSGIVYTPQPDHECTPPSGDITDALNYRHYPAGTVWECDCRATWVCQGMVKPYTPTGHVSASLEWKREGKRARRKRERQGVTPEQVFDRGQRRHPTNVVPPPLSTKSTPAPSGILGQGYSGGKPARLVGLPPPMFPDVINVPYGTITFSFPVTAEQADRVRAVFTAPSGGNGVLDAEPPHGVTVTDRHGHEWVRMADAWMSQHDGSARDWPYLVEQCGPLHTKWSEPACPAQQAGLAAGTKADHECDPASQPHPDDPSITIPWQCECGATWGLGIVSGPKSPQGPAIGQWERDLLERQADASCPAQQPATPVE